MGYTIFILLSLGLCASTLLLNIIIEKASNKNKKGE